MERQTPCCGCGRDRSPHPHSRGMGEHCPERSDCTKAQVPTTAIVYIAMQEFQNIYEPAAGFCRGTIFADLDKPLLAGGMCCGK